jgi:hypothetical protein
MVRRNGWESLGKLGLALPCWAFLLIIGGSGPMVWFAGFGAIYWAIQGMLGLILAGLHTYVLATYRRPWS